MKCLAMLVAISVIAASVAPVKSRAQSPATSPTAPVTGMKPDRTTADPATRKGNARKGNRAATEASRLSETGSPTKGAAAQAACLCQRLYVAFMTRDGVAG